jgi:hypothetical protein
MQRDLELFRRQSTLTYGDAKCADILKGVTVIPQSEIICKVNCGNLTGNVSVLPIQAQKAEEIAALTQPLNCQQSVQSRLMCAHSRHSAVGCVNGPKPDIGDLALPTLHCWIIFSGRRRPLSPTG